MRPLHVLRGRTIALLALCVGAVALTACGTDTGATASATSDQDREAARLRFDTCLRDNGVDVQERRASGSGGATIRSEVARVDGTKMRAAMQACDKYRKAAFGEITPEQRQEARDAFTKFSACMRSHGVDLPAPGEPGKGPATAGARVQITPKTQAAMKACQSILPKGRGSGGPMLIGPGQ